MNPRTIYIILAALLVGAVIIFTILPENQGSEADTPEAGAMPPGHPEVDSEGQPGGVGKVRGDFMQEYNRLTEKMSTQDASDTSEVLAYARMLLSAHQAAESIPYFERYLKAAPRDVTLMLDLTVAYHDAGQKEKAEEMTLHILSIDPSNATAMYNLGALYAEDGKKDKARKAWQKLIDANPDSPDAQRAKQFIGDL